MANRAWPLAALLLVAAVACGPSEAQREAAKVLAVVDALRRVDRGGRTAALARLEQLHPHGQLAVAARSACLDAYRALSVAEQLAAKVEGQLRAHTAAGVPPPDDLLARLDHAQKKLDAAEAAMPSCAVAIKALRAVVTR